MDDDETDDTRPGHRKIKGRYWRITDPAVPETLRRELVDELMAARRAVAAARRKRSEADERAARARVHEAKVALGERGPKWWEPSGTADVGRRVEGAARALLSGRDPDKSLCPSEVARVVDGERWRERLPAVRERLWQLHDEGRLSIRQGGRAVERGVRGPIRIARGARFENPARPPAASADGTDGSTSPNGA